MHSGWRDAPVFRAAIANTSVFVLARIGYDVDFSANGVPTTLGVLRNGNGQLSIFP